MKLLVLTQAIDVNDPVLGFFTRWAEEFSKHCESLTIICLGKGEYNLPKNVQVFSLGKEKKDSRFKYLINFYKYLWAERKNYDLVFIHMNQEYVLLGGLIWKLLGKKIYLWRNHLKGNFLTRLAVFLSNRVFCTSPQSFTAQFKKTKLMPVGIDTDFFQPDSSITKKPNSILFLGRIAPVKNVLTFVGVINELKKLGLNFGATIAGSALPRDRGYEELIFSKIDEFGLTDRIKFIGPVTQEGVLNLYREHQLYVNLTPSGSMDKTIFEAMSCGTAVFVLNQALKGKIPDFLIAQEEECVGLAKAIAKIILMPEEDYKDLTDTLCRYVLKEHSLKKLVNSFFYD